MADIIDSSEVDRLVADMGAASRKVPAEVRKVVQKGSLNIKNDWREAWTGHAHAPSLPYAVTYDTTVKGTVVEGEIGPDKDKRQGALGNIYEFGTPNNAPIPGGQPSLDAEEPRFIAALQALSLDGTGL